MAGLINKMNGRVLGSIIKMNRLHQNMSQKALSEGICVGSYLSRIENGEIQPSEQVISQLFQALAIEFNDDEYFLDSGTQMIDRFLEELNFNEFEASKKIFDEIESKSEAFRHSPLIIDYYIARLAFYCTTSNRTVFKEITGLLNSVIELMTNLQKFRFYLYEGIDCSKFEKNQTRAMELLREAQKIGENGHLWYWLGYVYWIEQFQVNAFDCFQKAQQYYLGEANLPSLMGVFEMIGLVYLTDQAYQDAENNLNKAMKIAEKMNSKAHVQNFMNHFAWCQLNRGLFPKYDQGAIQVTSVTGHSIPMEVTQTLQAMSLGDRASATDSLKRIQWESPSYEELFKEYVGTFDYEKGLVVHEGLLKRLIDQSPFLLSHYLNKQLIDYYKAHRKYKEVVEILEKRRH